MKDSKTWLLILVSLLLMSSSWALLWVWGYESGQSQAKQLPITSVSPTDPSILSKDSLNSLYNGTLWQVRDLNVQFSRMDSVKWQLDDRMSQFHVLKQDVLKAMRDASISGGLSIAHQKIKDLQKEIQSLRAQNRIIQLEHQRIQAMMGNQPFLDVDEAPALSVVPILFDKHDTTENLQSLKPSYWIDSIRLKLSNRDGQMQLSGEAVLFGALTERQSVIMEIMAIENINNNSSDSLLSIADLNSNSFLRDKIVITPSNNAPISFQFVLGAPLLASSKQYRIQFMLNGKLIHLCQAFLL
jgi:hypothetical protein